MTDGKVLYVAKQPHSCRPPDIIEFGERQKGQIVPPVIRRFPAGSVWQCDCGLVWAVRNRHPRQRGLTAGPDWFRESRRERRKRLGLRWWQR